MADNHVQAVPKYMSPKNFAAYTGLPYPLVLKMLKQGELTGFTVGGKKNYILVESYKNLAHPMISE